MCLDFIQFLFIVIMVKFLVIADCFGGDLSRSTTNSAVTFFDLTSLAGRTGQSPFSTASLAFEILHNVENIPLGDHA